MFVLGIDPGLSRCGYGCIDQQPTPPRAVAVGVLRTASIDDVPQRLGALQRELRALIGELHPDVVVVERVFFQHNAQTAMSVAQASGLAMAEAVTAGCEVVQYSPNEVKLAVTGDGAAGKPEVQRMVQTLLGLSAPPKPADAADACALALCHLAHRSLRRRVVLAGGGRR